MARGSEKSRELILESAESFIRENGAGTLTVEAIAKEAGCAKGLIHYHFKTKNGVIQAAAERLAETRKRRWTEAFTAPTPREAIDRSWKVLTDESKDGTLRAWFSLVGSKLALTEPTVKHVDDVFSAGIRDASLEMLHNSGLALLVPANEVGWYLGSVIHGMGVHLLCGTDPAELEGAYAAAWVGLLSLTRSGTAGGRAGGGGGDGGKRASSGPASVAAAGPASSGEPVARKGAAKARRAKKR